MYSYFEDDKTGIIVVTLITIDNKKTFICIDCIDLSAEVMDRIPGPGYNTLLLRLILGYPYSTCPHRQFHTLPGPLHIRVTLPNSNLRLRAK